MRPSFRLAWRTVWTLTVGNDGCLASLRLANWNQSDAGSITGGATFPMRCAGTYSRFLPTRTVP